MFTPAAILAHRRSVNEPAGREKQFPGSEPKETMNHELSKTISTCTIWLSVACILTFGICKMNISGDVGVFLILFGVPVVIVVGAVMATKAVWESRPEGKTTSDSASASSPTALPPATKD